MTSSVREAAASDVKIADGYITVALRDGRRISAPVSWYPRLAQATPEQQSEWRIIGTGEGIHWPQLDEDISVAGLLSAE